MIVEQLIAQCRRAQKDFKSQDLMMRSQCANHQGRYVAKLDRLHHTWRQLEAKLIREIYK